MSSFAKAAVIVKPVFSQGSFVCKPAPGLPFLLEEGLAVHFVPPVLRGPRMAHVASVRKASEDYRVVFDPMPAPGQMDAYAGCYCLAEVGFATDTPNSYRQVLGFAAIDEREGCLGTVRQVIEGPAQDLLEIEGPYGVVLVPAVDEFVVALDEATREVRTRVPHGLIDLAQVSADRGDAAVDRLAAAPEAGGCAC